MSRVGKYPVPVPSGVSVEIINGILSAKGKLGTLTLPLSDNIEAKVEDNQVSVAPRRNDSPSRMMWGTTRALVASMVKGVSDGFAKTM